MGISSDKLNSETTTHEPTSIDSPADSLAASNDLSTEPRCHVVLFQPEIPQNTGNIGRSCVAFGAKLWIVRPTGFQLNDRSLRRAGLDYWQYLQWQDVANLQSLAEQLPIERCWYFSRFASRSIWDAEFSSGDVFMFGSESSGLPDSIHAQAGTRALNVDTSGPVRSLNLATTVGIVLAEFSRQNRKRLRTIVLQ